MNTDALMREIEQLPNLFYMCAPEDTPNQNNCAILGTRNCPKEKQLDLCYLSTQLNKMLNAYGTGKRNEVDEKELVCNYKKILSCCDYRVVGRFNKEEQEEFLNALDESARKQIAFQIEVYKYARSVYSKYE